MNSIGRILKHRLGIYFVRDRGQQTVAVPCFSAQNVLHEAVIASTINQ